jgi:hypothetical protein
MSQAMSMIFTKITVKFLLRKDAILKNHRKKVTIFLMLFGCYRSRRDAKYLTLD